MIDCQVAREVQASHSAGVVTVFHYCCGGSPGFPLRWLGDGVSLLLGWEFRLSTQVEKPQVTLPSRGG